MEIMPRFGLTEVELKSVVDSACKEPPKGISKMMKEIILSEELKDEHDKLDTDEDDSTSNLQPQTSNLKSPTSKCQWASATPSLPWVLSLPCQC